MSENADLVLTKGEHGNTKIQCLSKNFKGQVMEDMKFEQRQNAKRTNKYTVIHAHTQDAHGPLSYKQ
jgi:hypothetical protein